VTVAPAWPEIWNAAPVPMLLLDPAGAVTRANLAAETFLNSSQAQLTERGWGALFPPDSPVHLVTDGGGRVAAYDLDICFIGGRRSRADVMLNELPDAPGWRVLAFQPRAVTAMIDRQLGQQGAARSAIAVAALLAHEIKNPLAGIRGAAQLIGQGAETGELSALIVSEVDRIRDLVDRMEGFTDTRPRQPRPENIHAILGHVRRLAEADAPGVRFRERYDPSLPPVLGDRAALVQLFLNLVKNACEAAPDGEISITTAFRHGFSVAPPGGTARVSLPLEVCVIDSGPGAPAQVADHMFDPFVTGRRGGKGLGLALVAKVVGDHGGLVEYERHDARTIMRVLLPIGKA
jgi:two-component system nitrogen regulation sensor histidine kinase GlnL